MTQVMRMVGKTMAAHPEALRARLQETLGRQPTDDELQATTKALSKDFNTVIPRNHWANLFAIASKCVDPINDTSIDLQ